MFLFSVTEKVIEQIAQLPMIWDAMTLEWRHCNTPPKKFMNGFACRESDPYGAIISKSHCQKALVRKSAK